MTGKSPPLEIPRRISLATLVADSLRRALAARTWQGTVPGERQLSEMLQVSRPTIRLALRLLAKDGLIEMRPCRRSRPLPPTHRAAAMQHRLVGLVTAEPVFSLPPPALLSLSEMRAHLGTHGFSTEVLVCPPGSVRAQQLRIEEFVRRRRPCCCVLLLLGREFHQWFATHSIPALVFGSSHPDVPLPSLDVDYRAVCRHAVGVFLARGHRRLALVVPDAGVAGDIASEAGFREAAERHRDDGVHATVVRHNGSAVQIGARLDGLFASSAPPSGLLVAKSQHVFVVLLYLLKRGLAVPERVSIIARDRDQIFNSVDPPIAHYNLPESAYARRLSRLMLQMAKHGHLPPEPNLILPKFLPGGTIRRITSA